MEPRAQGRRRLVRVALAGALALVTAACTGEPRRDLPDVEIPSVTPSSDGAAGPSGVTVPPAGGRLAVIDAEGSLISVRPDGTDPTVLATGALRQPAWSPDGRRIAWVVLEAVGDQVVSSIQTSGPSGERPTRTRVSFAPFYLSWDPTSSHLAFLGSPAAGEIELGFVEAPGGRARSVDAGQPYYFAWSPTGAEMLVHVGTDRLERVALDGGATTIGEAPGAFRAPAWSRSGTHMVFASVAGDQQQLAVHDVEEGLSRALVAFEGAITFVLSPDGSTVAFQVSGNDGVTVPLSVVELSTGEVTPLGPTPAAAFFWSPVGGRLLSLVPDPDGEIPWFRWSVWDEGSAFAGPRFLPSPAFVQEYVPFFDQYAQSMSLWSPDGSAFAYPGVNEDGDAGVWVQEARANVDPVLVSEGSALVAWSPA